MSHLMEEIEARDQIMHDERLSISQKDQAIQKFGKSNGFGQANPKEDILNKQILASFDIAQAQQEEKVKLAEKSAVLVGIETPSKVLENALPVLNFA